MTMVRLDEYVAILGTLTHHGPINPAQMVSLSSMDYNELMLALSFLHRNGCVLLETSGGRVFPSYSITERGLRILEFFNYRTSI